MIYLNNSLALSYAAYTFYIQKQFHVKSTY